jgi:orotate phosphoribosyltransferase
MPTSNIVRTEAALAETGALLEGHFQLSSGLHSDRYVQCARLLQHPDLASQAASALAARLDLAADVVVGPALGGIVMAHEVARALGVRAIFAERKDGQLVLRRGFQLAPGERVLIVEDVITTGKSAREVAALVDAAGAEVAGYAALVDRRGSDLPITALVAFDLQTWDPESCPNCAAGQPIDKPGSRA